MLLLGVFPRGAQPSDPMRMLNKAINERISKIAEDERVDYLNLDRSFLDEKGGLSKEIMPDLLHLSPQGYEIWAKALEPKMTELGL